MNERLARIEVHVKYIRERMDKMRKDHDTIIASKTNITRLYWVVAGLGSFVSGLTYAFLQMHH